MSVADFKDLMPATVTLRAVSVLDDYGRPQFGAGEDYRSRVSYESAKVRAASGEEVVARGSVWLASAVVVTPEDQIVLPDGTTPPILAIERVPDEAGSHHTKIYFG